MTQKGGLHGCHQAGEYGQIKIRKQRIEITEYVSKFGDQKQNTNKGGVEQWV